ncbi:hypothetical protein [Lysinibacillus sp. NPDC059133]
MGRYEGFITGIGVLLQYIIAGPVVAIVWEDMWISYSLKFQQQ